LLAGALAFALVRLPAGRNGPMARLARALVLTPLAIAGAATAEISLPLLFGIFLKIGATLYGSGYVLVAFLRADLVDRLGWLTDAQLLDAVAVGQVTPGPLFTTATFVGYLLAGPLGAAIATVGIFLPAFVFVALVGGVAERIRDRPLTAALLDGVNASAIGLMAAVTLRLGVEAIVDPLTAALAVAAAALLLVRDLPSVVLVVAGGLAGVIAGAAGIGP
jgi:chromate transporter